MTAYTFNNDEEEGIPLSSSFKINAINSLAYSFDSVVGDFEFDDPTEGPPE